MKQIKLFNAGIVGLRTLKTVLASVLALLVCGRFEHMSPLLVMMGVFCAMGRTIADSWKECLCQFFGVLLGSALGFLLLIAVPNPPLWLIGLCLLPVIVICNLLKISYAIFLSSVIFMSVCSGVSQPVDILARIRDTGIGLAFGLSVNILIRPYSNEKYFYTLVRELRLLSRDAVACVVLHGVYPDLGVCRKTLTGLQRELEATKKQLISLHRRKYLELLTAENGCCQLSERMMLEVEAMCSMDSFGMASESNRAQLLQLLGREDLKHDAPSAGDANCDTVMNYHLQCYLQADRYLEELLPQENTKRKNRKKEIRS